MNLRKAALLFCLLFVLTNAHAYITYLNGRIDRALYDGHDQKTIVSGNIQRLYHRLVPNPDKHEPMPVFIDGVPMYSSIDFSITQVVMGDSSLIGQNINLVISSFTWPAELVQLDSGVACIFILKDWNAKLDSIDLHIEVVIPESKFALSTKSRTYLGIKENVSAIKYLENQLLLVLKEEIVEEKLRQVLIQLGPILSDENCNKINKFIMYENAWLNRAALAALVCASQKDEFVKLLATDIENYFSKYKESDIITNEEEYNGYAPYYLYYQYVFFLDPNDRTWGTRWDDKEENKNKDLILKIKATGLLSKSTCKKLNI